MTAKLRAVVAAIALLVCGTLYIKWCHDPQVRAEALQGQQDTRDDSAKADHDHWKADFARRDLARDDSLARLHRTVTAARGEIARLKAQIPGARPDTTGGQESRLPADVQSPSGCAGAPAVCDSVIAEQDTTIAQLDSTVTLWQAMSADRDERISQLEGESLAYRTSRDAWKRKALRHWGCTIGVGAIAGLGASGNALQSTVGLGGTIGFGGVCGLRI